MKRSARSVTESTSNRGPKVASVLSLALLVSAAVACTETSDASDLGGLDVNACSNNWRIVHAPEQEPFLQVPTTLGWHGGRLFTVVHEQSELQLVSFAEGEKPMVLEGRLRDPRVWFEGDHVLFLRVGEPVTLPDGSSSAGVTLESVSVSGGPSQVLTTFRDAEAPFIFVHSWAVDSESIYWVEDVPGQQPAVRALPRTGGGVRMLATLDEADRFGLYEGMTPVGDHILVYPDPPGGDHAVFSIPKAGGEVRRLPTALHRAQLIGVASNGTVLVQRQSKTGNGQPRSDEFEMGQVRPGADAVEPFWTGKPPPVLAMKAWDDGAAGFYVQAWEWGPHDALHATVWWVDPEGRGERVACDPVAGSRIETAVVGADGLYGILRPGHSYEYWYVVKISR